MNTRLPGVAGTRGCGVAPTDVGINGRVYHLDPLNGEVLSSFDGPGGSGHQTTGVAWDGTNLWVHDEASGRARIFKVAVDDITEGGRCKQPDLGNLEVPDAGDAGGPTAELDPVVGSTASGCSLVGRRTGTSANPLRGIVAIPLVAAFLLRRRRRCIWRCVFGWRCGFACSSRSVIRILHVESFFFLPIQSPGLNTRLRRCSGLRLRHRHSTTGTT